VIHAAGLTRDFRVGKETVQAVRGLDLDVREGELVAFLGPNGAGKSTSLRMLTTLLAPTSGSATVAGHDIRTDPEGVRREIGYVGQGHGAADDQLVRDEIVVQGRAYGASARDAAARAEELIDSLELGGVAARKAVTLSGGQRRRLDIAIGMVHAPRLLFLDEPSTGLDPQSRANLWAHLGRVRERSGTTVFLTTHYLEEADAMAERVLVIDAGRVIADGTPERLKAETGGDLVTLGTAPGDAGRAADIATRLLPDAGVDRDGPTVRVRVAGGPARLPGLLLALHDAGVDVRSADVRRPTLDDVFLALTGHRLRDDGDLAPTPDAPASDAQPAGSAGTPAPANASTPTNLQEVAS
jgi:ABC-2 type transport system ATP-binding protein